MDAAPQATQLPAGVYRRDATRGGTARTTPVEPPTYSELDEARRHLRDLGIWSPTYRVPSLSRRVGRDVRVKYEIFSPIRSFKVRGALWAVAQAQRAGIRSIVTASTGNHGQGIAYAGTAIGLETTIFVPEDVDPVKFRQMTDLGARVERHGATLADAEHGAQASAAASGGQYLEDGEDPHLMAGAASVGSELLEQFPEVDTILVSVGGGNLAAAIGLALEQAGSDARLIGFQSAEAPGATASWLAGDIDRRPCLTRAGGLATDRPGCLALDVLLRRLDLMCLVDEQSLWTGVRLAYESTGYAMELAAAAPFIGMDQLPADALGDHVAIIASGGCIDATDLAVALQGGARAGKPPA